MSVDFARGILLLAVEIVIAYCGVIAIFGHSDMSLYSFFIGAAMGYCLGWTDRKRSCHE